MKDSSSDLLLRYSAGDDDAADAIFHRYLERLLVLARSRLSRRLAARVDPEDVVMSAYRSFFVSARQGRFSLQRSGDLWRLLVEITMHKLYRQVTFHKAERRTIEREVSFDAQFQSEREAFARDPTADEACALADEIEFVMSSLGALERRVFELRLQGWRLDEIATEVNRSERTVRRTLEKLHVKLSRRHPGDEKSGPSA